MARSPGGRRILPFRIPMFRIFYSLTYTILYLHCLILLAVTPISLLWSSIRANAYQYVTMISATYIFTTLAAVFIYSSRLYTGRSVVAAVGKPYIPVEKGEVGGAIRVMIVQQLERSARVRWESTPRDLVGEIVTAGQAGRLPEDADVQDYTVGKIIPLDPQHPPWGTIRHGGWSAPGHAGPDVHHHRAAASPGGPESKSAAASIQFADVVAELPHLIEARAVSLAPLSLQDPAADDHGGQHELLLLPDPVFVDVLTRPATMPLREYLTQLFYLGLIRPAELGQEFLVRYERARFSSRPLAQDDFDALMATFADLLAGMGRLDDAIVEQIRVQRGGGNDGAAKDVEEYQKRRPSNLLYLPRRSSSPHGSSVSSLFGPVTAREGSRTVTPFMHHMRSSQESPTSSVVFRTPRGADAASDAPARDSSDSLSESLEADSPSLPPSDAGSVWRHRSSDSND